MRTTLPPYSSMIEGRVRRSWGSLEWQTAQSHPRVGTPIDVPLPSTVKVAFIFFFSLSTSCFHLFFFVFFTDLWFRWRDLAAGAAPTRWSLQHRPCGVHRDCSAGSFLPPA